MPIHQLAPRAGDLMSAPLVGVPPEALVADVARTMLMHGFCAVPVISDGRLVGIVSEGDLLRRVEIGTVPGHSWLRTSLMSDEARAAEFLRTHGPCARDVMTEPVITVVASTTIAAIVEILSMNNIKRVVVVDGQRPIGIVGRQDILRALVAAPERVPEKLDESRIFSIVRANIASAGLSFNAVDLTIVGDRAVISATVTSEVVARALLAAVEASPGIAEVTNEIRVVPRPASEPRYRRAGRGVRSGGLT